MNNEYLYIYLYICKNAFDKWFEKSLLIKTQCKCEISVSTLLEDLATPEAKAKGLDVADFMICQLKNKQSDTTPEKPPVQNHFTLELEQMIETNPALLLLIDKLELIEC
ncbi:MAG: hypothetical protein WCK78_14365 [Paludibacter sp.]